MGNATGTLDALAAAITALDADPHACPPPPDSLAGEVIAQARALITGATRPSTAELCTNRHLCDCLGACKLGRGGQGAAGGTGSRAIPAGAAYRLRDQLSRRFAVYLSEQSSQELLVDALDTTQALDGSNRS